MIRNKSNQSVRTSLKLFSQNANGFSLVECVIALLVLLIGSLAVASVLVFAHNYNETARRRAAAIFLADFYMETVRNTTFNNLVPGITTQNGLEYDGKKFTLVREITDLDLLTGSETPGPEEKRITISVWPLGGSNTEDAVTVISMRSINRPGPKRENNSPN